MVYTTVRFKIIQNPAQQPISIGGAEGDISPTSGYLPDWLSLLFGGFGGGQQAPPINVGVPGTGNPDLINEPPSNTSCPSGYALNNQNQCVYVPTSDVGDITQVQVPSTSTQGGQAVIKTWFKNEHTSTLEYQVQIIVSGLSINVTSPALSVLAGQTAMIETTINIPTTAATTTYAGVAQLKASGTTASAFVFQDSETFALAVGTVVTGGTASIVPSATTVQAGQSVAIACTGFGAGEVVDIIAKVGTNTVASDTHTMNSSGAGTEPDLTFNLTTPAGAATITGTGRTSGKVGTATITVTAVSGGGGTTASIVPSVTSIAAGGTFSIACSGFAADEIVDFIAKVGATTVATDTKTMLSTGANTLSTMDISSSAPAGTAIITATGRTSGKVATANVTINATTPTTTLSLALSASSVLRGSSVSATFNGFLQGELVDIIARIGTTIVASVTGTQLSGASVIPLSFYSSAPTGTATVTAVGRTTLRTISKTITVTAPTTTTPPPTTTIAKISAPTSIHDGDSFTVSGTGFKGSERVTTKVSGVWKSSSSTWNNKSFSASITVTASSSGSFSVRASTPEVPSGVSATATIRSTGLTSGKVATRTISVI